MLQDSVYSFTFNDSDDSETIFDRDKYFIWMTDAFSYLLSYFYFI